MHGSKVVYKVAPLQFFKLFNALNSECGLPREDVTPEEITDPFITITVPTEGSNLVRPKFFSNEMQGLNNDYDFLSSKLPINCSKSLASLKFYKQKQSEHMQLYLMMTNHP